MAKNKIDPEHGKHFSKDYQPSSKAKKEGWKRKKILREISETIIGEGEISDLAKKVASFFGVNANEIDVETLADLKQLEKAIKDGDTKAYNSYKDRLRGRPKQQIDIEGRMRHEQERSEEEIIKELERLEKAAGIKK